MARINGDPVVILEKIVARLKTQLSLTDSQCYLTLDPNAKGYSSDLVYIVSPMSGDFDPSYWEGGGTETLKTDWGISVTIRTAMQLDDAKQQAKFLTDNARGVFPKAKAVIAALAGFDPIDNSGDEQLRDPLIPAGFTLAKQGYRAGDIIVHFKCNFDWDLA